MKLLVTGGTGFIGSALLPGLVAGGDQITVLSRNRSHADSPGLRYVTDLDQIEASESFDAFINLAGESMAQGRWSEARKRVLVESRVGTTRALVELATRLAHPPATVLSASAIGIYGHQGDERLAEGAAPQDGFSHSLCLAWEDEARQLEQSGCRVCLLRLGVVLDRDGGAYTQLAGPFRFGLGVWLGRGQQWLSWIHRRDAVAAITFLLQHDSLSGAFNLTAPEPVTSKQFCRALQAHQRTFLALPVPGLVMRVALGEMADELLLNGQRVIPQKLQESGFKFAYPELDSALAQLSDAA